MLDTCQVDPIQKTPTAEEQQVLTTALLAVWGLDCPNCVVRVRNGLLARYGVVDVDIAFELGTAEVLFNPNLTNIPALISTVGQAGGDWEHQYFAVLLGGPGLVIKNV